MSRPLRRSNGANSKHCLGFVIATETSKYGIQQSERIYGSFWAAEKDLLAIPNDGTRRWVRMVDTIETALKWGRKDEQ